MAKRISELDAASALTTGDELLVLQSGAAKRGEFSTTPSAWKAMAWPSSPSGTFTPTLSFGGASTGITYSTQSGYYTRVGNMVFWSAFIILTSKGTATGSATLSGLPYTIQNTGHQNSPATSRLLGVSFTGQYATTHTPNTKTVSFSQSSEAGTNSALTDANFANTAVIYASGFYITSE